MRGRGRRPSHWASALTVCMQGCGVSNLKCKSKIYHQFGENKISCSLPPVLGEPSAVVVIIYKIVII